MKSAAASSILEIETPRVFLPLLSPARYKGAWGGRGSGKSHFFAELLIEEHLCEHGLRSMCVREVQKSLAQSSKQLLEDKIESLGVGRAFKVFTDRIQTPGDGLITFQGMQDHTAESVKSFEGLKRVWIEEAQTLSHRSLTLLRPTIRADGSEIWASWNPRRKTDAIDDFLRAQKPANAIVVQANWRDNPWFPKELDVERRLDMEKYPERYDHIWEGGYATIYEGAYFAKDLALVKQENRIRMVAADPVIQRRAFWDIGVRDRTAIWVAQFVGSEIRVLDYIEGQGQPLAYYLNELRTRGHGKALCVLPHDGVNENNVTALRYEDHVRAGGFSTSVVKNQGKGADKMRIEAARRLFTRILFNDTPAVLDGLEALGAYHERKDEKRDTGLGPDHDWASHGADAFGLMCIAYEEPRKKIDRIALPSYGVV